MLAYQQKESTARVASIMENTNLSKQQQVSEIMRQILTSRLSLSKHLAHNLGNLLLLGKIGVFHNRRNASSRLLLRSEERRVGKECRYRWSREHKKIKQSRITEG